MKLVTHHKEIDRLVRFCAPIFEKMMIPFCGLDVAKDKSGEYWLIEANSSPGFDYFIEHEGPNMTIKLYENILQTLRVNNHMHSDSKKRHAFRYTAPLSFDVSTVSM